MKDKLTIISDDLNHGIISEQEARTLLLGLLGVSESLPSDDEIKLTNNGFGSLEDAIKKANYNVR